MNNLSNQGLPITNLIWLDYYSPCPFIIILCKIRNEGKEREERNKKAKTQLSISSFLFSLLNRVVLLNGLDVKTLELHHRFYMSFEGVELP